MSAIASAWALEVEAGSPTNKLVLLVLADRHNKDTGKCCPSVALLAKDTELSQASVKRALIALAERKLITKERRTRANGSDTTSQFTLNMEGFTLNPQGAPVNPYPSTVNPLEPELEPEVEPEVDQPLPQASPTKEERDQVWDALKAQFGEPTTPRGRARMGATRRELLSDSALTPGQVVTEIPLRAQRYRAKWPDADLTLEAFAKHWPDLREGATNGRRPSAMELVRRTA